MNSSENEIPMKKYFWKKRKISGLFDIQTGRTWICSTDIKENAQLITNALNNFNPNAVTTVIQEYP